MLQGDSLAEGSETKGKKICPVCDEEVQQDAKVCPSCSTDLTLFSADEGDTLPSDAEEIKSSLISEDDEHIGDLLKAADEDILATEPAETVDEDVFECPECSASVPMDATICPKCGVEFEVEEVFECPMCKTLVDINVDKCPNCGAEFEEQTELEEKPSVETPEPEISKPEEEKPETKKPVSFTDRMKQIKEESPGTTDAPPTKPTMKISEKPMSFADRMRALKEEGEEEKPEIISAKPSSKEVERKTTEVTPESKPTTTPKSPKEEKYKDLPALIGEVKKLLVLAKESGIDVTKNKALVSQAVSASKKKDITTAIQLMKEGKTGLHNDLRGDVMGKYRTFASAVSLAKKGGKDTVGIERILESIKKAVEVNDYPTAMSEVKRAEGTVEGLSGASVITEVEIGEIEKTIQDAIALNVNVSKSQSLLEEVKKASANNDTEKVSELTKEINDNLIKILPRYIAKEMREAKADLRDIKMMNIDITEPVEILKKANNSVKDGDYSAALHAIKNFKDFINKIQEPT